MESTKPWTPTEWAAWERAVEEWAVLALVSDPASPGRAPGQRGRPPVQHAVSIREAWQAFARWGRETGLLCAPPRRAMPGLRTWARYVRRLYPAWGVGQGRGGAGQFRGVRWRSGR